MSALDTAPVLELRRVTRRHGEGAAEVIALRDVSLTVLPGELVAVMGPSGSGKATQGPQGGSPRARRSRHGAAHRG